jgi:hypothetical protein
LSAVARTAQRREARPGAVRRFPKWTAGVSMDPYWVSLVALKDARDVSFRDLEEWTGMSHSGIHALTRPPSPRRMTITPENMELLARALEVPPEYFVEYRTWKAQRAAADAIERGADLKELLARVRALGGE